MRRIPSDFYYILLSAQASLQFIIEYVFKNSQKYKNKNVVSIVETLIQSRAIIYPFYPICVKRTKELL